MFIETESLDRYVFGRLGFTILSKFICHEQELNNDLDVVHVELHDDLDVVLVDLVGDLHVVLVDLGGDLHVVLVERFDHPIGHLFHVTTLSPPKQNFKLDKMRNFRKIKISSFY